MSETRSSDKNLVRYPVSPSAGALLLAEYIHRSANDFATACAELHLVARMQPSAAAQDRLARVAVRLHALASIQRLLQPPRSASIDLGNSLYELCQYQAEARFAELGAYIRLRTCDVILDAERGWTLLAIVSELLTNAARHAFHQAGGIVFIDVANRGGTILCRISDNGIGMPVGGRERRTGTAIIEELASGAGIDFAMMPGNAGTTFELRLTSFIGPVIGEHGDG